MKSEMGVEIRAEVDCGGQLGRQLGVKKHDGAWEQAMRDHPQCQEWTPARTGSNPRRCEVEGGSQRLTSP